MSNLVDGVGEVTDFDLWLGQRNRWLQTAAKNLLDLKRVPTEDERAELVRLCKQEASGQEDAGFSVVAPGSFAAASVRPVLRVESVSDVYGVNAIKPGASLPFGTGNITVIYGQNGSGKSGFARLLKQLCGSRAKDEIRPNVFSFEDEESRAQCAITVDGKARDVQWHPGAEPHALLRHAQVFDSKAASLYLGRTESSYEPSSMRFISTLITIADAVADDLGREKDALVSAMPQLPQELAGTPEQAWLSSLKSSVSVAKIDGYCNYSEAMEKERIQGEALLAEKDIAGRLSAISKDKLAIASAQTAMANLEKGLSDEKAARLFQAKELAVAARKAAQEVAQRVFANSPLSGVGEPVWKLMWEQARKFSVEHAYVGHDYPMTAEGAHCVLCQQTLGDDAALRLQSFENFVSAGLETAAVDAENALKLLQGEIPKLPTVEDWIARSAQLHFDENTARFWYATLGSRHAQIGECLAVEALTKFDWAPITTSAVTRGEDLAKEEQNLAQLQQDGRRQELETKVKSLKALQWLSQNKPAILAERVRLVSVDMLTKAVKLCATNSLSGKRTELGKSELDAGYQARFIRELGVLGGTRLPVTPVSKAQGKGKITFGLTLVGTSSDYKPEEVLSEGELRIAALAAFLADTTGSNQLAPFIFDDPISSLDQDFEERVVARLVELSVTRQVIIFTHRLSLVTLVEAAVKKHCENPANQKITHSLQTLRRLNKMSGLLAKHNVRDARPDKAIKVIRDETLVQLRKLQAAADVDAYDALAKSACSDFRIILERTVEFVLLNDVVARFRRDVMTKGKLRAVAKVTVEDCDLIDRLMSVYSVFEHSQADELPQIPVELDEFERDVNSLSAWMQEFSAR